MERNEMGWGGYDRIEWGGVGGVGYDRKDGMRMRWGGYDGIERGGV